MTANDPVQAFRELTPDQLLDAVEARFLAAGSQFADGRFLALNSYENRVYQVGVEDGSPIIAKFYRPGRWSDPCILEEHRFTRQLADAELPVIAPLADAAGETLFHYQSFRFAVYPCRGGRAMELDNPDHLEQMGRFVARIHAIGEQEHYQHRPAVEPAAYIDEPSAWLIENRFIPVHLEEAYGSLVGVLGEQVEACFARAGDVRRLRLHGDFHPSNVLWTEDGPHIVDFDDARIGPAVQDLWMFLSGDREYSESMLTSLLGGYLQFREFDFRELHLVEALRTMRLVHHAGWLARRWDDPAFPLAFPWFDSLDFWERHIQSLREQVSLMSEEPIAYRLEH